MSDPIFHKESAGGLCPHCGETLKQLDIGWHVSVIVGTCGRCGYETELEVLADSSAGNYGRS